MIEYFQDNTLKQTSAESGKPAQVFSFKRRIRLVPLSSTPVKRIHYDSKLKIHFESAETYKTYEVEIADVSVALAKEYRKATELQRRLRFRYDWIQLEQCSTGLVTEVANLEELRRNWVQLKENIMRNYQGNMLENYLERISKDFTVDAHFRTLFDQYSEFGLLFAPIPESHKLTWSSERTIQLDHTPATALMETIRFKEQEGDIRTYTLEWKKPHEEAPIELLKASGTLEYSADSKLLDKATVDISFAHDNTIVNEWSFLVKRENKIHV